MLPDLLQDVPVSIRNRTWFQHEKPPAYFTDIRSHLNAKSGERWIGFSGFLPSPSSNLLRLNYFVWELLNSMVYATSVDSESPACVREIPGIFSSARSGNFHFHEISAPPAAPLPLPLAAVPPPTAPPAGPPLAAASPLAAPLPDAPSLTPSAAPPLVAPPPALPAAPPPAAPLAYAPLAAPPLPAAP
ncbi:vegetative cell wall protein gp1-like [Stegodyphus dumicola]|uniref:vegetative cell wall protein gp1-like n=1 Tax=Stegodyphus dumicola TaxID=202533 RepID=UPI0015B31FCC|nr:vegetative cell wall protein gp1-like [Stegodyphus dumicola]